MDEVAEDVTEPITIIRTLVSTSTEHHDYLYAGGILLRDVITTTVDGTTTTQTMDLRYDENGHPYELIRTVGETTTTYYYITNLQGDVMHLVDGDETVVASYTYDPYGNILTATGDLADVNPLRYRGYYYDGETGFYYLQSRYYDAEIDRFINADSYLSTGQSFLGHNAFAYCGNNPVNRVDTDGEFWITVGIMGVGLIGAVVSAVTSAVTQKVLTGTINWKSVGISSASGFVSGAVAASPLGIGWQIGLGMAVGGASYAAGTGVANGMTTAWGNLRGFVHNALK